MTCKQLYDGIKRGCDDLEMVEGLQEEGRKKKHHPSIPTCPQTLGKGFGKSESRSHCLMSGTKETGINMAGEEEGKEPGV